MEPHQIKLYLTVEGKCPYRKWLDGLDKKIRARVQARVFRFEMGNLGDSKHLEAGVFEARFTIGPGYRLYFGLEEKTVVVLLTGGDKSTQKADIEKAIRFWKDYQQRSDEHGTSK